MASAAKTPTFPLAGGGKNTTHARESYLCCFGSLLTQPDTRIKKRPKDLALHSEAESRTLLNPEYLHWVLTALPEHEN